MCIRDRLNGEDVALSFDGTNWVGTATAVQGSEAFFVANFVAVDQPVVNLALVQRNENVGDGTTIIVSDDEYETEFDNDNDGFFNFDEFNDNTDALDLTTHRATRANCRSSTQAAISTPMKMAGRTASKAVMPMPMVMERQTS